MAAIATTNNKSCNTYWQQWRPRTRGCIRNNKYCALETAALCSSSKLVQQQQRSMSNMSIGTTVQFWF